MSITDTQQISSFSCKNPSNATIFILNTIQCVDFWILYNVLTSEYYTMYWLLNTIQCVDFWILYNVLTTHVGLYSVIPTHVGLYSVIPTHVGQYSVIPTSYVWDISIWLWCLVLSTLIGDGQNQSYLYLGTVIPFSWDYTI
jgi:hypothetical protein